MAPERTAKRRRLSPSRNTDATNGTPMSDFYSQAAEWDLEQDYEQRPRKGSKKDKEKTRLPIKTAEGVVEHVAELEVSDVESDNPFGSDEEEEDDAQAEKAEVSEAQPTPEKPTKAQILEAKEELARMAMLINEDPEEHITLFKRMAEMVSSPATHATTKKLALAAQVAIYRDVIPGYRIRPLGEEDMSSKISKEVRKLRGFEQSLISGYHNFVKQLAIFVKDSKDTDGLKTAAINCACSLLIAVPHFNYRTELLKIIVGQLGRRSLDANFVKCRETLEEIFTKDEDGIVSMEAVNLVAKMMKSKEFRVHASVLDTFLHLRLLSEFSSKGSRDRIDKKTDEEVNGKKSKSKREFRTKKERKVLKEQKAVAKDFQEADAIASHEQRDRMQADTLKLVFSTYFRILKLRSPQLMGAVLEGLAKYAHLINQDFFGDLLEALKELIAQTQADDDNQEADEEEDEPETQSTTTASTRNAAREALLCCITAFALLEGQDVSKAASSLHLDLSYFTTQIYRTLVPLSLDADIEFNPTKSLRLPDPNVPSAITEQQNQSNNKVNFQTPTVLLLRCLHSTLMAKGSHMAPPVRVAGFTKRLMSSILQVPEKSSLALLALLSRVAKQHGRKIAPLWHTEERKGDGVFNPHAPSVEGSNVFAGTVWEGELLRLHYCPQVRDAAKDVEKIIAGANK
ncbi:hypothetical protein AJ80_02201 [Polytolypa hystricis UAMH7299]|uniref:Nucleolar complex-associated protein 3 n=1 Tax=Polytolypa hystricis (strain UAMH7299) TaxID=1447883 RepID=A0A2B7YRU2_POLH7|nr:hypothetical protein AJ80_02201 [Polytolypa hystricis UAMH7299]